jgi:hypothetical protein
MSTRSGKVVPLCCVTLSVGRGFFFSRIYRLSEPINNPSRHTDDARLLHVLLARPAKRQPSGTTIVVYLPHETLSGSVPGMVTISWLGLAGADDLHAGCSENLRSGRSYGWWRFRLERDGVAEPRRGDADGTGAACEEILPRRSC